MIVMKFGGTSVGTAESIRLVADAVEKQPSNKLVVLSANAGTTDDLVKLIGYLPKEQENAKTKLGEIRNRTTNLCSQLQLSGKATKQVAALITEIEKLMEGVELLGFITDKLANHIISFGELISTLIFYDYFSKKHQCKQLDIANLLTYNKADSVYNLSNTEGIVELFTQSSTVITQGFICKDENGNISNLGRGGSDYTASILAAELGADELQIWTDVSGVMTADPRIIRNAKTKDYINITNLSKMAFFGAKVIHPDTLKPTMKMGIPVSIRNTFQSENAGTYVTEGRKDNNPAITVKKGCYIYTLTTKSKKDLYLANKYISSLVVKHNLNLLATYHNDDTVSYVYEKNIDELIETERAIKKEKVDLLYVCELTDSKINVILKNVNNLNPKRIDLDLDNKSLLLLTNADNDNIKYNAFHDMLLSSE